MVCRLAKLLFHVLSLIIVI